jgi:Cu/Ag efflux protein CusF
MKFYIALSTASIMMTTTSAIAGLKIMTDNFNQTYFQEQSLPKVQGELKKIDLEQRKLTIKHKDIPNLDMPGMTMVFKVDEKIDLSKFKVADQILFTVDKVNGAYTVLTLEK